MIFFSRKRHFSCLAIFLIVAIIFPAGQELFCEENTPKEYRINKHYLKTLKDDFFDTISSPKKWENKNYLTMAALIGTTVLLFTVDDEIHKWVQERKTSATGDVAEIASSLGGGAIIAPMLVTLYGAGELFGSKGLRRIALLGIESWLISGAITMVLKFVIGRSRPKNNEGSTTFIPFSASNGYYSFPSGHSSSAFAVASVVAKHVDNFFVDFFVYGLATSVALSRIHKSKHWASDIFLGSALGYFIGKNICDRCNERESKKVKINLQFSREIQSISLSFRF